jgi:glycosyltransferase involved in cell wall biosynthesis
MSAETGSTRWVAISWAPYSRRSEMFARELGGTHHCIHYLRFQSPLHAPLKYVMQAVKTLRVLSRDRPDAIHVQNPPFVCGLVVALHCALRGAVYVTEHHSAAFGRMWAWALPMQKLIARRAVTNIVTNEHWAGVVQSWGGSTLVMYDAFLDLPQGTPYSVGPGFTVAFVSVFAADEPVDAVVGAAAMLPDVQFYVTGDRRKAKAATLDAAPANVNFTGFLEPNGAYLGLLRSVDAVIVLTTRDNTLQLAGCEAVALGKPLVTSDWSYLRELFGPAAVYVAPTATAICAGVVEARDRIDELRDSAIAVRAERRREWRDRIRQLRTTVASRVRGGSERAPLVPEGTGTT